LALIYYVVKNGSMACVKTVPVPMMLLAFGGLGIAAGIAMAGGRVIETVGSKITDLNNTRGFSVNFAAATTVMASSKLGLPVSTTHAAVGGVIGVGLARGFEAVNFRVLYAIALYWVLTVPMAAVTSMMIFKILQSVIL
jgi:PiT family inorganic phosphate transporter